MQICNVSKQGQNSSKPITFGDAASEGGAAGEAKVRDGAWVGGERAGDGVGARCPGGGRGAPAAGGGRELEVVEAEQARAPRVAEARGEDCGAGHLGGFEAGEDRIR